jgi:ParB-like chromosome segregation protein Spo0J
MTERKGKARIEWIDPHKLKVPAVRITSVFEDDLFAMFEDDVDIVGIEQPLLVAQEGEDLWVYDGKHRRDEALKKGIPKVPCIVREMTLKEVQIRNLMSNRLRGKTKISEEIMMVKDLTETHGMSIEEILETTAMKRERLEQLLIVSRMHHSVLDALEEEKLSLCAAYELAKLRDKDAQERMLMLVIQYRLKCKDVRDAVEDAIQIQAQKSGEALPVDVALPNKDPRVRCHFCEANVKLADITTINICKFCYAAVIQVIQAAKMELEGEAEAARKLPAEATAADAGSKGGS